MAGPWGSPWGSSWYTGTGGGTSTLVPYLGDCALDGRAYRIDWEADVPLDFVGIDQLRSQSDDSNSPGEQSINPETFWRRSPNSWHVGAGQRHFDRREPESNPNRFWDSQGINPWERFTFSLLHDVTQEVSSAQNNLRAVVAGDHVYWTNGTSIQYWTDVLTGAVNNITGEPATAALDIATNGFHVWTAHGADGIYRTTRGAATTASHITGTVEGIGFVRNRVLAFTNNILYDVTALAVGSSGALPAALYTHGNADWQWVDFAEGSGNIYIGGFSGDKSRIFRTAVAADGVALSAPVVAAELPDGEVITCLAGYLGKFVLIGTNKGFRLAVVATGGDLALGSLVETPAAVRCFEGQAEFVWFGYSNFSATHTGVGRLSTAQFSDLNNLVPAYASDLMVEQQGDVLSIITFQDRTMFTVSGLGFYYENENLVESGYIDSGLISFNMTEDKIGLFLNAQHSGQAGMHEVLISVDEGVFTSLGVHDMGTVFNLGQATGMNFEVRHVLYRDTTDTTLGLTLHNWVLRVQPKPEMTDYIYVTIFLADEVESLMDTFMFYDTMRELDHIINLYRSRDVTTFQVGGRSDGVILDNYRMQVREVLEGDDGHNGFNASCQLKLKRAF